MNIFEQTPALSSSSDAMTAGLLEQRKGIEEAIAVIGMSCRLPGANNIKEFWDLLMDETCKQSVTPRGQRETSLKDDGYHIGINFLSVPVDELDSQLFNLSPAEISFLDPQTRILLEVAWEGLEAAGINPTSLRGSNTGVFFGAYAHDFVGILDHNSTLKENYFRKVVGSLGGSATKLSHILGATGPSINSNAACTSSMVSVHLACQSLRFGETSLALACGVNLILQQFTMEDVNGLCAQDGRCKSFDEKADGFGRAEGCTVLVLKRLSDAMKNKDHIHAVIRGTSIVQEGITPSMMTPTVHCEALAMKNALQCAGVNPSEVSYVEAHGTGTQVGDPMEIEAIAQAYSTPNRLEPLIIGSVKTNIGHTESASGITGIIKTILALEHEIIPKHRNLVVLNPKIDLQSIPAVIPIEHKAWPTNSKTPRIAGVSCFGLTGTESHAIIQEAPRVKPVGTSKYTEKCQRPNNILSFSAKTLEALEEMLIRYETYFPLQTNSNFADICYSANTGRAQNFRHRAAIIAETLSDAKQAISNGHVIQGKCLDTRPKICFLFPGFGCAYDGMTTELYSACPVFRENFDKCDHQLKTKWTVSFKKYVNGTKLTEEDKENFAKAEYSQTFILVVEYCLFKTWESWGIKPEYILGHSLGEFSGTVAAGIIQIEDAIDMVIRKGRLLEQLKDGGMIAVQANKENIKKLLQISKITDLDFAAVNTETQTVMAGTTESIRRFADTCQNNDVKCTVLGAKYAFHSRQMALFSNQTRKNLCNLKCMPASGIQYISSVYGRVFERTEQIDKEYFISNTVGTVRFLEASYVAYTEGCRIFLEMGVSLLSSFIKANFRGFNEQANVKCFPSLKKIGSELSVLLNSLAELHVQGFDVNWEQFDEPYFRQIVQVPHYPFQRKKYALPTPSHKSRNIGRDKSKRLHPLLGEHFNQSIASGLKAYQTKLNLEEQAYLSDHKIGELVIFPGAGFLEIAVAAGFANKPEGHVTINNLVIESPMAIEDSIDIQVIVSPQQDDGFNVEIYSIDSATQDIETKWIRHSQANLLQDGKLDENVQGFDQINISAYRREEEYDINHFYEAMNNIGLKFGPAFRSLQKVWKIGQNLVAEINVPKNSEEYLIHPILSDGMIQTALVNSISEDFKDLRVPIAINRFIWFKKPQGQVVYVYSYQTGDSKNAALLDSDNNLLALMKGIALAKTSVQSISDQVVGKRPVKLPNIFEEVWKPILGPLEQRIDLDRNSDSTIYSNDLLHKYATCNQFSDQENIEFTNTNQLCYLYIQAALYEIGWEPVVGCNLDAKEFCHQHRIKKSHERLITRFFAILQEEGYLTGSNLNWTVRNQPPPKEEVYKEIQTLLVKMGHKTSGVVYEALDTIVECGEQISNVLKGKVTAQDIMFTPNNQNETLAEIFYATHPHCNKSSTLCAEGCREAVGPILNMAKNKKTKLRILEVGSGTGLATKLILPILKELAGNSFLYTFTDVSASFFSTAQEEFEEYKELINYKVFDLDKNPLEQGFWAGQFDIIIACNVLHICKQLTVCIQNLRSLTAPSGLLLINETTKPLRHIDITFGLFDDYWRYEDILLRPDHCVISNDKWKDLLLNNGYDFATCLDAYEDHCGVVTARACNQLTSNNILNIEKISVIISENKRFAKKFERRLQNLGQTPFVFTVSDPRETMELNNNWSYIDERNSLEAALTRIVLKYGFIERIIYICPLSTNREQEKIAKPFVQLSRIVSNNKWPRLPSLFICTQGISPIGDYILPNPSMATLQGIAKTLRNELPSLHCKVIDMDYLEPDDGKAIDEVVTELWANDNENQVAYRNRRRFVPKLIVVPSVKMQMEALNFPSSNCYQLELPVTKAIRDLKLVSCSLPQLQDTEIQVQVKASGLNFKDVLNVLKPTPEFDDVKAIGLEFAGVITSVGKSVTNRKVGDAVFGWALKDGTLQSHVTVPSASVINIPNSWTFTDAATLPTVFKTVYYCLVTVGKLQAGETILIHTGSGGVGLCAIQLAKYIGANIMTTAGSNRKREYLKKIGIQNVFNSRTLDYGEKILEATAGKGVDFVLNSLTGPGFKETSLEVCAPNARFIEMSKLDIWTTEEVAARRPDITYQIIDVTVLSNEVEKMLLEKLKEMVINEIIKPLPHLTSYFANIRDALQYLQKAKHIGKVVIEMPQKKMENSNLVQSSDLFNDRSTYLITGGLGGIGLEIAKWMANSGAKFIVLVGRNRPNKAAQEIIESLTAAGKQIFCLQGNVGKYGECKRILNEIKSPGLNLPPLRGIMHSAGVLNSALLSNMNWSNFESTFDPKLNGGWNLHNLTKNNYNLQHFVLFSSVVAHLGLPGLSNHCAANCFLDALAHHRHGMGLPALSVNWGQWGQVGIATDMKITGQALLKPNEAIYALETLMRNHSVQKCVAEMDVNFIKSSLPNLGPYLEGVVSSEKNIERKPARRYKLDKEEFLSKLSTSENKYDVVFNELDLILRQILMCSPQDMLDQDEKFKNLGMDSLMSVQLKNSVDLLTNHQNAGISDFVSEDQTLAKFASDITQVLIK